MSEFVDACEVHDGVAQQHVLRRAAGQGLTLHRYLRHDVDDRSGFAAHEYALSLAVQTVIGGNPPESNQRRLTHPSLAEFQFSAAFSRPCFERKGHQFPVRIAISRHTFAIVDEISNDLTGVEPLDLRLKQYKECDTLLQQFAAWT